MTKDKSGSNVREAALAVLMQVLEQKGRDRRSLQEALAPFSYFEERDAQFLQRLTKGTLERLLALDDVINQFAKTKVNKMKPVIRSILRLAVYQLLYMDSVPASAAVNEAVKLAEKNGLSGLKPFVNGVLRNIVRNRDRLHGPDKKEDLKRYLSVRYSLPMWIIGRFIISYGPDAAEVIAKGLVSEGGVTIRVNRSKASPEEVMKMLTAEGISVERHPYLPYAFLLKDFYGLTDLPGFAEGLYAVQDISSMIVGEVSGAKPGMKCLDICAAPGGKTMHLADLGADVTACDRSLQKVSLIRENTGRCGFLSVQAEVNDAREYREDWKEKFDLVVADVPCSGLGVMGRKYDIRYHITPAQITELVLLQKEILSNAVKYVKPGGYLLYSTCTINREENEGNAALISESGLFEPLNLTGYLPEALLADAAKAPGSLANIRNGRLQILPGFFKGDGFYLALFRRKN